MGPPVPPVIGPFPPIRVRRKRRVVNCPPAVEECLVPPPCVDPCPGQQEVCPEGAFFGNNGPYGELEAAHCQVPTPGCFIPSHLLVRHNHLTVLLRGTKNVSTTRTTIFSQWAHVKTAIVLNSKKMHHVIKMALPCAIILLILFFQEGNYL